MFYLKKKILTVSICLMSIFAFSQTSIKANATTLLAVPNFGVEFNLGEKTTFQFDAMASLWSIDGVPYKFLSVFPEFRYYTREAGAGFFVGAHIGGATFKLQKYGHARFNSYEEGYSLFYGATLGYQFIVSDRINLELFLGGGSSQAFYKGYSLETGERTDGAPNYNKSGEWIPYRGGLMLVYKLKGNKRN